MAGKKKLGCKVQRDFMKMFLESKTTTSQSYIAASSGSSSIAPKPQETILSSLSQPSGTQKRKFDSIDHSTLELAAQRADVVVDKKLAEEIDSDDSDEDPVVDPRANRLLRQGRSQTSLEQRKRLRALHYETESDEDLPGLMSHEVVEEFDSEDSDKDPTVNQPFNRLLLQGRNTIPKARPYTLDTEAHDAEDANAGLRGGFLQTGYKEVEPIALSGSRPTIREYLSDFLEERDFTATLELGMDGRVHVSLSLPRTSMGTTSLLPPTRSCGQALIFLPPVVSTKADGLNVVGSIKKLTIEDGLRPFEAVHAPTSLSFTTPSEERPSNRKKSKGVVQVQKSMRKQEKGRLGKVELPKSDSSVHVEDSDEWQERLNKGNKLRDDRAQLGHKQLRGTASIRPSNKSEGKVNQDTILATSPSETSTTVSNATLRTDDELLDLWANYSVLKRYSMEPTVFSNKGIFRVPYRRLAERAKELPQPIRVRKTQSRVLRNRDTNQLVKIDLRNVFVAAIEVHPMSSTTRIIIAFTRASGEAPAYGTPGMTKRAAMAAKAFADLGDDEGVVKVAVRRTRISSRAPFFDKLKKERTEAYIVEMVAVLNAAKNGREVVLLSVGADGLTTNIQNYLWISETWPHLDIHLVVIIPTWFPGDAAVFKLASNGIRYGRFSIKDIAAAVLKKAKGKEVKELLRICAQVNMGKEHLEHRELLTSLTSGRSSFRVHPDTVDEDGVGPELRKSRALH